MSAPVVDTKSAPPPDDTPPKTTLYCPSCGHENRANGDWLVRDHDGRTVSVCPVCDEAIATRWLSSDAR